jgi:hypothetical protein
VAGRPDGTLRTRGAIHTLVGISCPDARTLVAMTSIPAICETNPQYFNLPIFGV